MATLRAQLIRLAHENPEFRREILPLLASGKTARQNWDKIITGPKARISYSTGPYATMLIEEMHQKGKRRLRRATFDIGGSLPRAGDYPNAWLMENLVMWMRPKNSMSYEQAVSAFGKAMAKAESEAENDSRGRVLPDWSAKQLKRLPQVSEVTAYMVEPADYTPITAEGRDFTVSSEWGSFSSYAPGADFQSPDPHYTKVVSKSPTAARKLYKVLKSNPDQLQSMSFADFTKFLNKMKIAWEYQFSQWS